MTTAEAAAEPPRLTDSQLADQARDAARTMDAALTELFRRGLHITVSSAGYPQPSPIPQTIQVHASAMYWTTNVLVAKRTLI